MRKKIENARKKGGRYASTGWVGGLAVAGGEVRRGKPSQTGDLTDSSEPRQHPAGVRRIEDASARPPHPKMAGPADGVAQSVLRVYACFLAKSSSIFKHAVMDSAIEFPSILAQFGCFLASMRRAKSAAAQHLSF